MANETHANMPTGPMWHVAALPLGVVAAILSAMLAHFVVAITAERVYSGMRWAGHNIATYSSVLEAFGVQMVGLVGPFIFAEALRTKISRWSFAGGAGLIVIPLFLASVFGLLVNTFDLLAAIFS